MQHGKPVVAMSRPDRANLHLVFSELRHAWVQSVLGQGILFNVFALGWSSKGYVSDATTLHDQPNALILTPREIQRVKDKTLAITMCRVDANLLWVKDLLV